MIQYKEFYLHLTQAGIRTEQLEILCYGNRGCILKMFFQWRKSNIFIQNRIDIVCHLFYKIIIFAQNHIAMIMCKSYDFILIYKRIICFLLDRTQLYPLCAFMLSASLSVIFSLTQPAMPAKKDNEIPLYIKQKYRPNNNNNLALRTAYGTTNKQAQPHPAHHKHAHDIRTRKRAGDRRSGPSSQEEKK